jgi:hypothetical protein
MVAMLLTFAHAGHVVVDTLVFGGPVVLLGGAVLLFAKFEQRLAPRGGEGDEAAPPPAG